MIGTGRSATRQSSAFGDFLVSRGLLGAAEIDKALEMQRVAGGRLGTNLLELGVIGETTLLEALGECRRTSTVAGYRLRGLRPEILRLVPVKFARRHGVVPVERQGNTILLAAADPGDPLAEDEVGLMNGCLARTVIALEVHIEAALGRYYGRPITARIEGLAKRLESASSPRAAPPAPAAAAADAAAADAAAADAPPASSVLGPAPSETTPAAAHPPARSETQRSEEPGNEELRTEELPDEELPDEELRNKPPETEIEYVELDAESRALLTTDGEASPEERLAAAAEALGRTEIRDDVADVLLEHTAPYLERRLLLIRRKERVVGWRGDGPGVDGAALRAIDIGAEESSIFLTLEKGADFWLNPLPKMPAHLHLLTALGGEAPKNCLVLPVRLRSRVVAFLYGDNGRAGLGEVPLDELRRLVGKAGLAFEVCILKNKIRVL